MSDPRIDARLSDEELDAIEKRMARAAQGTAHTEDIRWLVREDVPALVAEVRSLRAGALRESVSPQPRTCERCGHTVHQDEREKWWHDAPYAADGQEHDVVLAADAVGVSPPPQNRVEEELIADAWQLVDWWLNARDKHVENHDDLARQWIERCNAWLDSARVGVSPPSPLANQLAEALRSIGVAVAVPVDSTYRPQIVQDALDNARAVLAAFDATQEAT